MDLQQLLASMVAQSQGTAQQAQGYKGVGIPQVQQPQQSGLLTQTLGKAMNLPQQPGGNQGGLFSQIIANSMKQKQPQAGYENTMDTNMGKLQNPTGLSALMDKSQITRTIKNIFSMFGGG